MNDSGERPLLQHICNVEGLAQNHVSLSFFFNDTATTEIYTLSLHDALPICLQQSRYRATVPHTQRRAARDACAAARSEEHTSELQSQSNLVCRLLLEKKKKKLAPNNIAICLITASHIPTFSHVLSIRFLRIC